MKDGLIRSSQVRVALEYVRVESLKMVRQGQVRSILKGTTDGNKQFQKEVFFDPYLKRQLEGMKFEENI